MLFKQFDQAPTFIFKPLTFLQKKNLAKLRLGSLELKIETGRFSRPCLDVNERICLPCLESSKERGLGPYVEDECHFLFVCSTYAIMRENWYSRLVKPYNFRALSGGEKLKIVLNEADNVKLTAQFITDAFTLRSKIVNK